MIEDYRKARKLGNKQVRKAVSEGRYPYLPALDDILPLSRRAGEVSLGAMEIPLDLIAGTVTRSRGDVFSEGFLPIADPSTEFAMKWSTLYESQLADGIRDSVTAYEYLQHFYVGEGNKRVSVMRYLDNPSILARVTRIMPRDTEDVDYQGYREFLDFWRVAPVYGFFFSEHGSFARMAKLLGRDLETPWPEDEVRRLSSAFRTFEKAFSAKVGSSLPMTAADAFLVYLNSFATSDPLRLTPTEANDRLSRIWDELVVVSNDNQIEYLEQPSDPKSGIIPSIRGLVSQASRLRVAFVYDRSPEESGWVALHEKGRLELEQRKGDEVETTVLSPCFDDESFNNAVETAVVEGNDLIITVSPRQFDQTMRAAAAHPGTRFINCSINLSSGMVRTFHARMYEAKFLMGALAASLAENHRIGYAAFSPIYGSIAEINAFAIGASMVDAQAEVHLKWIATDDSEWLQELRDADVDVFLARDHPDPLDPDAPYGLCRVCDDGSIERLALSVWDWGRYYELLLQTIRDDTWSKDASEHRDHAINYWWGMTSGVVRLDVEKDLPFGQRKLVKLLERALLEGILHPFEGAIIDQRGDMINQDDWSRPSNEQLASMRWLNANVVGRLPKSWELSPAGVEDVNAAGVISEQTDAEEE